MPYKRFGVMTELGVDELEVQISIQRQKIAFVLLSGNKVNEIVFIDQGARELKEFLKDREKP